MRFLTGPMAQLAWVVDDIDAAEQAYDVRWARLPDIQFEAGFYAHISLAYVGDLQLELIQPVSGESLYTDFLAERGPGVHHACWYTDDLEATLAESDRKVVFAGAMADEEIRFAYLAPGLPGLPYIEIVQLGPGMRAYFSTLKENQ